MTEPHPDGLNSLFELGLKVFVGIDADDERAGLAQLVVTLELLDRRLLAELLDLDKDNHAFDDGEPVAVLDEMGVLAGDMPFVHESLIGTCFTGTVAARTRVGDHAAIVPEIGGSAWITGEHTFLIDADDPLRAGFRI